MLWIIWLVPVSMLAVGVIFSFFPPKHINDWYGYRTSRSRRDQESWDFAHRYCGHLCLKNSFILLLLSLSLVVIFSHWSDAVLAMLTLVQIIPFLVVIAKTEKALKATFGDSESKLS